MTALHTNEGAVPRRSIPSAGTARGKGTVNGKRTVSFRSVFCRTEDCPIRTLKQGREFRSDWNLD
jgi:hypothetical protein